VIRAASPSDLDAILAIEARCYPRPWPRAAFESELGSATGGIAVGGSDVTIAGYLVYRIVTDEAEILNLAVDPPFRRSGQARALVRHLLGEARTAGCRKVWLEVRRSNQAAERLYRSVGFREAAVRRAYYQDNGEDALVLSLDLTNLSPT
jgi:ribosomal-protein-alanine N-acetyltransferase